MIPCPKCLGLTGYVFHICGKADENSRLPTPTTDDGKVLIDAAKLSRLREQNAQLTSMCEKLTEQVKQLESARQIGATMANVLFNLKQNQHLDKEIRGMLEELQERWDAVKPDRAIADELDKRNGEG